MFKIFGFFGFGPEGDSGPTAIMDRFNSLILTRADEEISERG